jgi:hypothetical protein
MCNRPPPVQIKERRQHELRMFTLKNNGRKVTAIENHGVSFAGNTRECAFLIGRNRLHKIQRGIHTGYLYCVKCQGSVYEKTAAFLLRSVVNICGVTGSGPSVAGWKIYHDFFLSEWRADIPSHLRWKSCGKTECTWS